MNISQTSDKSPKEVYYEAQLNRLNDVEAKRRYADIRRK